MIGLLIAAGTYALKSGYERKRIALLGGHLGQYEIEKLMEGLTEGYMGALPENARSVGTVSGTCRQRPRPSCASSSTISSRAFPKWMPLTRA